MRPDDLVHLLQGVVNIDFRTLYFKRLNNMIPHKLSSYNIKEKAKADAVDFKTAQTMVTPDTGEQKVPYSVSINTPVSKALVHGANTILFTLPFAQFKVQSFAVAHNPINRGISTTYYVRTDEEFTVITACRCNYYAQHQVPCKHMYLTAKVYKGMEISYKGESYEIDHLQVQTIQNDFEHSPDSTPPPSLEKTLSPAILLLLHRQRAEKAEQKRITRENEQERELKDLEADLRSMISEIAVAAGSTKKRKCTLEYFQNTVAGVRKTLLEVKGLNAVQAGQRCQK